MDQLLALNRGAWLSQKQIQRDNAYTVLTGRVKSPFTTLVRALGFSGDA